MTGGWRWRPAAGASESGAARSPLASTAISPWPASCGPSHRPAPPWATCRSQAALRGQWQQGGLAITQLTGRRGGSNLELSGRLGSRLDLSGQWRLAPGELPNADRLPPWLLDRPLAGSLRADGRLASPRIRVETGQPDQALIGPWRAAVSWSNQMLRLEELSSENLQARATLPIGFQPGRGVVIGDLLAKLSLRRYPVARLRPLLGTGLQGVVDVSGQVRGPAQQPPT